MRQLSTRAVFGVLIVCAAAGVIAGTRVSSAVAAEGTPIAELWQEPTDLRGRDLFRGPWGAQNAPDSTATYTFVKPKAGGVNPGVVVRDPQGRVWHVKQSPLDDDKASSIDVQGAEGPVEVTLSRILSAVGYHQPPLYFLQNFTMTD